jgi:adenylate cyclase
MFFTDDYMSLFKSNIAIFSILLFTIIIIIYESLIHYFMGRRNKPFFFNPRLFGFFNNFSEITLLSILLVIIIEHSGQILILKTPATLTYFIFIVLSTFRLNYKLSVFSGTLAAAEYILISFYYSNYAVGITELTNPVLTEMHYLGQGLIMIITGIAAGFVSNLIKKKMVTSWNSIQEKNEIIDLFGQQISPEIVKNIIDKRHKLSGTRQKVCIMFLDIRQFTPFVEHHEPEEIVAYLNTLFGFMIEIVQSHHGVINQFLGDGFMATFGAPVKTGNSSRHATKAAIEIIKTLDRKNKEGIIPKTRIGIGLHFDEAVTGNIGSSARKQYSITGRVVIMASRIEQLNKKYSTNLLISKEVYEQLNTDIKRYFEWLDNTLVKGCESPISIYNYIDVMKIKK